MDTSLDVIHEEGAPYCPLASKQSKDFRLPLIALNSDTTMNRQPSQDSTGNSSDQETLMELNQNKRRNKHMHYHFPDLPVDEVCIADFSCALQRDLLIRHGRLYIGKQFICFHSPIANTRWKIHVSEIEAVIPKTILMVPTALTIETDTESVLLMSFAYRQNCIRTLHAVMKQFRNLSSFGSDSGRDTIGDSMEPHHQVICEEEVERYHKPVDPTTRRVYTVLLTGFGVVFLLNTFMFYRSMNMVYTVL
jgi:hypothetical protein